MSFFVCFNCIKTEWDQENCKSVNTKANKLGMYKLVKQSDNITGNNRTFFSLGYTET
uniref:Uncharacterized protein n=1 Tax=Kalanchoe fedtschenkoi TaxID=63787 RepID=A0A7N1A5Y6_KALFE